MLIIYNMRQETFLYLTQYSYVFRKIGDVNVKKFAKKLVKISFVMTEKVWFLIVLSQWFVCSLKAYLSLLLDMVDVAQIHFVDEKLIVKSGINSVINCLNLSAWVGLAYLFDFMYNVFDVLFTKQSYEKLISLKYFLK